MNSQYRREVSCDIPGLKVTEYNGQYREEFTLPGQHTGQTPILFGHTWEINYETGEIINEECTATVHFPNGTVQMQLTPDIFDDCKRLFLRYQEGVI